MACNCNDQRRITSFEELQCIVPKMETWTSVKVIVPQQSALAWSFVRLQREYFEGHIVPFVCGGVGVSGFVEYRGCSRMHMHTICSKVQVNSQKHYLHFDYS